MVIKVGGSLMYKDGLKLNEDVLKKVKSWYEKHKKEEKAIVFVAGGGKLSRNLGEVMKEYVTDNILLHSVAMEATQVSGQVLKAYLGDTSMFFPQGLGEAFEYLLNDDINNKKLVSGGLKPGWSTDMDAAIFADILKEKEFYKLTDVEGVYTADPRKDPNAKLIKDMSWKDFRERFGVSEKVKHTPNNHLPVSPETVFFCERKGITMYIAGGINLINSTDISKILDSGTKIHP